MSHPRNNEPVITVQDVGKRFIVSRSRQRSLKTAVIESLSFRRQPPSEFWALKDLSFQVARGETLGIIGANGAGKSTLLSLLAGTKQPTEGRVETHGKISALLELGAGFHPDLTGRENVFLAGAIMGLSRRHMQARLDAIVDFAELHAFIDEPVKHYSSGMYVRLGFAVAVEVDPDILLIDEVLAVGDSSFQRKCLDRMDQFRKQGKTMLIISHDLHTIRRISDRILLLDGGRIKGLGDPRSVVRDYEAGAKRQGLTGMEREYGTGEVRIESVRLANNAGEESDRFCSGESLHVELRYRAEAPIEDPVFGFAIGDTSGRVLYGNNTQIEAFQIERVHGEGSVKVRIGPLTLGPGAYLLSFSAHSADHRTQFHRIENACAITVEGDKSFEGCYMPCQWQSE